VMVTLHTPEGISQEKIDFVKRFVAVSDKPDAVDDYLAFFTSEGVVKMGIAPLVEHAEGIRKMRENMWSGVTSRRHTLLAIFDGRDDELMLHGTVDYDLCHGVKVDGVSWASKMTFASGHGPLLLSSYIVWFDMAPLKEGLEKDNS